MTTEEFIARARIVHGEKYEYNDVIFKKSCDKVTIHCDIHGSFQQRVYGHLSGKGCYKCGRISSAKKNCESNEHFVESARKKHGFRYDYSKVNYIKAKLPVTIVCEIHGDFLQSADSHLQGNGCDKCSAFTLRKREEFESRAAILYNGKYRYYQDYLHYQEKVKVLCDQHGIFYIRPVDHLSGFECKKCRRDKTKNSTKTLLKRQERFEAFIKRATKIHRNKYSYPEPLISAHLKIAIICKIHGTFRQTPNIHVRSGGCPQCARNCVRNNDSPYPTSLYLVSLNLSGVEVIKIGCTYKTVKERFSDALARGVIIQLLHIEDNLTSKNAYEIEGKIKQEFFYYKTVPKWLPSGWTECFRSEATSQIREFIHTELYGSGKIYYREYEEGPICFM